METARASPRLPPMPMTGGQSSVRSVRSALAWVVVPVLAYSSGFVLPGAGVDNGWALGLSWAREQGLRWGSDIAFTYGPWGFVSLAVPLTAFLTWFALAASLILLAIVSATTFRIVTPDRQWWGLLVAFFVASVSTYAGYANTGLVAVTLLAVAWIIGRLDSPWWLLLTGVLAGASLFVKFNTGLTAIAIAAAVGFSRTPMLRSVLIAVGGAIGGVVLAWVAAGESLARFPTFLARSLELAIGFRSGMGSTPADDRLLALAWPALGFGVIGGTLFLAYRLSAGSRTDTRVTLLAVTLISGASFYLASSVRLDSGHAPLFLIYAAGVSLPIALAAREKSQLFGWVGAAAFAGVSVLGFTVILGTAWTLNQLNPINSVRALASSTELAVSAGARETQIAQAREVIRTANPVPAWELELAVPPTGVLPPPSQSVTDALGGETIHAEPWAIGQAWASGNRWQPAPVFQTFQAYTAALDQVNAEELTSTDAAEMILRQVAALDGKNPSWESPAYQLELACRYVEVASDDHWQALQRSDNRCGDTVVVEKASANSGQSIPVPSIDGSIVTMEVRSDSGFPASLFTDSTISCDDAAYRVAQGLDGSPLIVDADALSWTPQFLPRRCQAVTFASDVDVTFLATPFA